MNMMHNGAQAQISDELYMKLYRYIKMHNITPRAFAEECGIDYYIFKKAVDRHIKMTIFQTTIDMLEEKVEE